MGLFESIRLAFAALSANKMRSLLTMLGIIIGISAVITITTIGNSIQKTLQNTFSQINVNYMYISPTLKPYDEEIGFSFDEYYELFYNDRPMITDDMLNQLVEKYPDKYSISMEEYYASCDTINPQNKNIHTEINGATDGTITQGKLKILKGRNLTHRDHVERKHTILISDIFERQYFGENADSVGQTLTFTVNNGETQDFVIVGVYEYSEAKLGRFEPDTKEEDKITPSFIPLNTCHKLKGIASPEYRYAYILWNEDYNMEECEEEITLFFEKQFEQSKIWTIYLDNQRSELDMINNVINIVTIAISIIAAISLVVGGVGVMNIMLVSIIERTREIGVRKALGAKNSAIRTQFVIEAITICLVGGIIGILIGIGNGMLIGTVAKYLINTMYEEYIGIVVISVNPSITAILISVIFSMLIGVFFGYYPANKAAQMNPIDALRYD